MMHAEAIGHRWVRLQLYARYLAKELLWLRVATVESKTHDIVTGRAQLSESSNLNIHPRSVMIF